MTRWESLGGLVAKWTGWHSKPTLASLPPGPHKPHLLYRLQPGAVCCGGVEGTADDSAQSQEKNTAFTLGGETLLSFIRFLLSRELRELRGISVDRVPPARSAGDLNSPCSRARRRAIHLLSASDTFFAGAKSPSWLPPPTWHGIGRFNTITTGK